MNLKKDILSLLMAAVFTSCSPVQSEPLSKNAFGEYEIVNLQKIAWLTCLEQAEDHYLIFFYSEKCQYCHEIMGDVLDFAQSNIVKTYFLNTLESDIKIPISKDVDETIDTSNIDDLFIAGTPTIIEVKEHIVKANIPGKDDCLTFLNEQRLAIYNNLS